MQRGKNLVSSVMLLRVMLYYDVICYFECHFLQMYACVLYDGYNGQSRVKEVGERIFPSPLASPPLSFALPPYK